MSPTAKEDEIVWTSEMPDRRKGDRRQNVQDFQANGRALNVTEFSTGLERRRNPGRRKSDKITLTITGRAIEIDSDR